MALEYFCCFNSYRKKTRNLSDSELGRLFRALMPSCRMCNHYKRAHDLETFRRYIAEIPRKLQENYIYKVGIAYGNVLENPKAIKFYFEKVRDNHAAD